jgi:hypothetical protein
MTSRITKITSVTASILTVFWAYVQTASASIVSTSYTPLVALPNGSGVVPSTPVAVDPATFIQDLFKIGIGAATILSVVMITYGGLEYIMTDSVSKKGDGRNTIQTALAGLLLALFSYVILQFLNPAFVKINTNIASCNGQAGCAGNTLGSEEANGSSLTTGVLNSSQQTTAWNLDGTVDTTANTNQISANSTQTATTLNNLTSACSALGYDANSTDQCVSDCQLSSTSDTACTNVLNLNNQGVALKDSNIALSTENGMSTSLSSALNYLNKGDTSNFQQEQNILNAQYNNAYNQLSADAQSGVDTGASTRALNAQYQASTEALNTAQTVNTAVGNVGYSDGKSLLVSAYNQVQTDQTNASTYGAQGQSTAQTILNNNSQNMITSLNQTSLKNYGVSIQTLASKK